MNTTPEHRSSQDPKLQHSAGDGKGDGSASTPIDVAVWPSHRGIRWQLSSLAMSSVAWLLHRRNIINLFASARSFVGPMFEFNAPRRNLNWYR